MKDKKTSTFVWKGLGFPIKLINALMTKQYGEWFIDINFNKLMRVVLESLIRKQTALTIDELRYIRSYLRMTDTQFAKLFGVTRASIAEWESGKVKISPALELCIRLHVLTHLKVSDKEFRELFNSLSLAQLSKHRRTKMFSIDASKHLKAIEPV